MSFLRKKIWSERMQLINDEVELNLKSLYSYAILLNQSVEERDRWAQNSQLISGESYAVVDDELKSLICQIMDYFISHRRPVPIVTAKHNNSSLHVKADQDVNQNHDQKLDCNLDTSSENSDQIVVDMDDLRDDKITNLADLCEAACEAACKGENPPQIKLSDQLVEKILTEADKEQDEVDQMMLKRRQMLIDQQNDMNPIQPREIKFTLNTVGDENAQPIKSVDELTREAPQINALLKISPIEREELYERLFLQAKKNVESLVASDISSEEKDALIAKEADRLLKNYIESN